MAGTGVAGTGVAGTGVAGRVVDAAIVPAATVGGLLTGGSLPFTGGDTLASGIAGLGLAAIGGGMLRAPPNRVHPVSAEVGAGLAE